MILECKILFRLFLISFILIGNIYAQEAKELFSLTLEELMNVEIVTASKHYESVSNIPASIVIIERDEIETYGYTTIEDILQNITGFYMVNDYYWLGSNNYGIRGFFSTGSFNDVIIMVNGVNQVGDSYSDYPSSKINVPVEAIDRIEIIRGPMSVIYGSGAFMGAINIITNKHSENNSQISGSIGTLNTKKISARISGKEGSFEYTFNGGIFRTDGVNELFSEMTSNTEFLENVGLKTNSRTENMLQDYRQYFGISTNFKGFTFDFEHNETNKGVFDGIPAIGDGTLIYVNSDNISLKYDRSLTENLLISAKIGFFSHHYSWNYNLLYDEAYATNTTNTSTYEVDLNALYKKNNYDILVGAYTRSISYFYKTYDYPIYADQYSNTKVYLPGPSVSWFASYTQGNIKILNNLQLTLGLRIEKLNKYDIVVSSGNETSSSTKYEGTYYDDKFKFIPRIALIYQFTKNNIFKLLYGKATKQPSISQNTAQLFAQQKQLEPAVVSTIELNYIYSSTNKLALNISLFRNMLSNLIVKRNIYDTKLNSWTLFSTNKGELITHGIEIGIKSEPVKNIRLELGGLYQKSNNLEEGLENIELGYSPNLLGNIKIAYKYLTNSSVAFVGRYISQVETTWEESLEPKSGNRIGDTIDPYFVLDFNLRSEKLFSTGIFADLKISNIFNKVVRYPTTTGNKWADKGTLGFGREILFSVGYKF